VKLLSVICQLLSLNTFLLPREEVKSEMLFASLSSALLPCDKCNSTALLSVFQFVCLQDTQSGLPVLIQASEGVKLLSDSGDVEKLLVTDCKTRRQFCGMLLRALKWKLHNRRCRSSD